MNDNLVLFLGIILSLGFGAYIGMLITKLKSKSEQSTLEERESQLNKTNINLKESISVLELERDKFRDEREGLNIELAQKNVEFDNLHLKIKERDKELIKQQEQLRKDFELMATKILDEKSEKFTLQNKENIKQILNPLQEKIQIFEKKVEDTQKESISMHSALKEQLLGLKDLNQKMTKEATNLTRALKGDSKMQGNWGELVLERVLEKSGLEKIENILYNKVSPIPKGCVYCQM